MKILKTDARTSVKSAKKPKGAKTGAASKGARGSSGDKVDHVQLSEDAILAAADDEIGEVTAINPTMVDGPLPDPYETSRKMLEQELGRVFRATYLADGAK